MEDRKKFLGGGFQVNPSTDPPSMFSGDSARWCGKVNPDVMVGGMVDIMVDIVVDVMVDGMADFMVDLMADVMVIYWLIPWLISWLLLAASTAESSTSFAG